MSTGNEAWRAVESTDLVGSTHKITVTGTVQTSNTSEDPKLVEAAPQGINDTILILDLKVPSGVGGAVMGKREVKFEKTIRSKQYRQVTIRREGGAEVTIDVDVAHS